MNDLKYNENNELFIHKYGDLYEQSDISKSN